MYPTIDMKATGDHIWQIMQRKNITVRDVQQYLNLGSVQSVYHWLSGRNMPAIDNLYALSALFGLSVDDILIGNKTQCQYLSALNERFLARVSVYYNLVWKYAW